MGTSKWEPGLWGEVVGASRVKQDLGNLKNFVEEHLNDHILSCRSLKHKTDTVELSRHY